MRRRRRGRGCLLPLLALVLIGGAAVGLVNGADYLLYAPWAYGGIFGRPTLTRTWEGTLTTHSGVRYAVYLQLDRYRNDRGVPLTTRGQADLDGHISWCTRPSPITASEVYGHANRSASSIVLETDEVRRPPPGLYPISLHGAWHDSTLALHVLFYLVHNHGYEFSTQIPDAVKPVPLTLHPHGYTAFQAACSRL